MEGNDEYEDNDGFIESIDETDDEDLCSDSTDPSPTSLNDDARDEIQEVRKQAAKETRQIRALRKVMTVALLSTAAAVTAGAYLFLKREQTTNFLNAYEQFSTTVVTSVLAHRQEVYDTYDSFSTSLSTYVEGNNNTEWPFVRFPFFEITASKALKQSRTELMHVMNIVRHDQREEYLNFVNENYEDWLQESHRLDGSLGDYEASNETYHPYFTRIQSGEIVMDEEIRDFYCSSFQWSPPPNTNAAINLNIYSSANGIATTDAVMELRNETLSSNVRPYTIGSSVAFTKEEHAKLHNQQDSSVDHPHYFDRVPVLMSVDDPDSPVAAIIAVGVALDAALQDLLPDSVRGIVAVIRNNCNQSYTWTLDGPRTFYLGEGDLHESKYNHMELSHSMTFHSHPEFSTTPGHCQYSIHVYPSSTFENDYDFDTPEIFAALVAIAFVCMALTFFAYDRLVLKRNEKLVVSAARSNALVSSLFPSQFRDRIMGQNGQEQGEISTERGLNDFMSTSHDDDGVTDFTTSDQPLADIFLDASLMFADICGFTAWSSVRQPHEVMVLLETLFGEFDKIAARRQIFKVETVGDCYVAASGMPTPRANHVVHLVRFARNIMERMDEVVKDLEVKLGPDTADLCLRIGVHSGQCTGGVLRGQRARFQLFGDTINTTARIESSGRARQIHCSQEAADRLIAAGKKHWIEKRPEKVNAKGKGEIQTYFLRVRASGGTSCSSSSDIETSISATETESALEKERRLVSWNVEIFSRLLKEILWARRQKAQLATQPALSARLKYNASQQPLDEVKEIVKLPELACNMSKLCKLQNEETIELPQALVSQVEAYITAISRMYNDNPFHNFEHASHVVMSVNKLLSRVVEPSNCTETSEEGVSSTYGITSCPLTQFSCAFSALIHDVDHSGVPNDQLVKEGSGIADAYQNRSVAEQNSFVLAWNLLNSDKFAVLRGAICQTEHEEKHFRQLVINSVMATDIVDVQLKNLRNDRWDKAFHPSRTLEEALSDTTNRKATIVIEHLIQASDVSHTMQHWSIYQKWNERFFQERMLAYYHGRADSDPSIGWYKGELGFFDFYIIPLAKKLKECGVFGKSSDEFLNYALDNRKVWEARGQEVVQEMTERAGLITGNKPL